MRVTEQFFSGYIEGYFGRELTWDQRFKMIDHLASLGMNSYLYAPKEDPYHRIEWKTTYPEDEQKLLQDFAVYGKEKGISVIPALGPGLSYDYRSDDDYRILIEKFKTYFTMGINHIALLMDDISTELPDNCKEYFTSLGEAHGKLLSRLLEDLKQVNDKVRIWFCPTIYTDQFVKGKAVDSLYIQDLAATIPESITIMWTGPEVISEELSTENCGEILSLFSKNVVFWDNLYANDYAPYRIFLGSFENRDRELIDQCRGIMINPTGLFHTDRFLLSLFNDYLKDTDISEERWIETAKEYEISELFFPIKKFFWLPFTEITADNYSDEKIKSFGNLYDDLIVGWVNPLKIEWFTYLQCFNLDITYLQRDPQKMNPWLSHRYPPLLAEQLAKK